MVTGNTTTTIIRDGAKGDKGDKGNDGVNAKAEVKPGEKGTHIVLLPTVTVKPLPPSLKMVKTVKMLMAPSVWLMRLVLLMKSTLSPNL